MSLPHDSSRDLKDLDLEAYPEPHDLKSEAEVAAAAVEDEDNPESSRSWRDSLKALKSKDSWIGDYVSQMTIQADCMYTEHLYTHACRFSGLQIPPSPPKSVQRRAQSSSVRHRLGREAYSANGMR